EAPGAGLEGPRQGAPGSALRQRDELVVARDLADSAGGPVALRALDPLLRARHEVPPDVARAERLTADHHHAAVLDAGERSGCARPRDPEPARPLPTPPPP